MGWLPAVTLLAVGSGCGSAGSVWELVETDASEGVNIVQVTGSGEHVWGIGQRFEETSPTLLHFDGEAWERIAATDEGPGRIFASSPDDLWMAGDNGQLGRSTDGATWADVDLSAHAVAWVYGVWGSASDDVWISAEDGAQEKVILRYDGDDWSRVDGWREALDDDPSVRVGIGTGCSLGPDAVWIQTVMVTGDPEEETRSWSSLLHWNGEAWTEEATELRDDEATIRDLACHDASVWISTASGTALVMRGGGGSWSAVGSPPAGFIYDSLAAGVDGAWVTGAEVVDDEPRLQVWRADEDGLMPTLGDADPGREGFGPRPDGGPVQRTAAWTTTSGRTFVFGVDGLILEHL